MKKYFRFAISCVVVVATLILLAVFFQNKKLKAKLLASLARRRMEDEVKDLRDQSNNLELKANSFKISAQEYREKSYVLDSDIELRKKELKTAYVEKGLSSDEIVRRFNKLRI